jgi:hypothetical protein
MGNEAACTLRHAGKTLSGKALLESSEIIFRGDTRLKIAFNAITAVQAKEGELQVRTRDGLAVFELGPQAAKWCDKIANPKSLLDKLGVKAGQSVSVIGSFPAEFLTDLKKQGALITRSKIAKDSTWIFLAANQKRELDGLSTLAKSIQGATALWLVYPKGQSSITEADVRSASLKAGLVDIKVASFSATHTALKFVLPKSKR